MDIKLKLNYLNILGIIMLLFSVLVFSTKFLDSTILQLTYPFLEGSSEGKSVLLFGIMGSLLLLYPLFNCSGRIMQKISSLNNSLVCDGQKYLKLIIILVFLTYIVGIIIEIMIRVKYGVSPFTTFVAMNPSPTSTSITHSHVFKSVLGDLIGLSGLHISGNIHTGSSLISYTSPLSFLILITFPLTYLLGLVSFNHRKNRYKFVLAFAITTALIGMLDGGLFSTPAIVGLAGILGVYYIKQPFSLKNLIKPSLFIVLLIVLRLTIGVLGTHTDYHEITILDEKSQVDLNGYSVTGIEVDGNETRLKISTDRSDKYILTDMVNRSKGKASGIFMSWNIFSWLH